MSPAKKAGRASFVKASTTTTSPSTSKGELDRILRRYGASAVSVSEMLADRRIVVEFAAPASATDKTIVPVRLECDIRLVYDALYGQPIVWPRPSHGKGTPRPWRTAAECIDWSLPCPSIFARKKPLADKTQRRIAAGLRKFVLESARPFIVQIQNASSGNAPISLDVPMKTVTAHPKGGGFALVAAFLAKHQSEWNPQQVQAASLFDPVPTVKTRDSNALITSTLVALRGGDPSHSHGEPMDAPLRTISAGGTHHAEVRAFLVSYYGTDQAPSLFKPMPTATTRDRLALVAVHGEAYAIVDIGMRMLAPRELYRAQGFPDSYRIDVECNQKPITKTAQVRMVGNSVCPPVAAAIVSANCADLALPAQVAA